MPTKVYAAAPSPAYFLPFNGDFADYGPSNKTTSAGETTYLFADPVRGRVAYMTGHSSGYVRVINNITGSYTKSLWVKLAVTNPALNYSLISDGTYFTSTATGSDFFWLANATSGGGTGYGLRAGPLYSTGLFANAVWNSGSLSFPTGQWVHVAVTFDGATKGYRLYQSGVLVGVATGEASIFPSSSSQAIGAFAANSPGNNISYNSNWSGWIDDVQVWDTVLTQSEIQEVMSQNRSAPAPTNVTAISTSNGRVRLNWDPVSTTPSVTDYLIEYKFNTGSTWQTFVDGVSTSTGVIVNTGLISPMLYDFRVSAINGSGVGFSSTGVSAEAGVSEPQFLLRFNGNYNDSTSHGNNGVNNATEIITDPTRGQVGNFTGIGYVSISTGADAGSFSRAGWVQNLLPGASFRIIFASNGGSFLWLNGSSQLGAGHEGAIVVTDSATFPVGSWVHVGVTFDAVTRKYTIYKNGAYVGSGIAAGLPASFTGVNLGRRSGQNDWQGYMDDMAQWRGVLSSGQMQAVYEGNLGLNASAPNAPSDFTGVVGASGQVILSWSGVISGYPVSDYHIEYKYNTGVTWSVFSDGVSANTGVTVTGLTNNVPYDFRVSAVNAIGTGTTSSIITITSVPLPEPKFLLRFEGNYLDSSSNGNHGINGNTTLVNDPVRGLVARFNGASYVQVPIALFSGTNFTKAAWVYAATGTTLTNRNIINHANSNFLRVNNSLAAGHLGNVYVNDSTTFASGTWVHVAITFDNSTKKYILYKNGAYAASGTAPHSPLTVTGTYIGSYLGILNFWSGYMDDAEMWDVALNPYQIQSIYNGANNVLDLTGSSVISGQVKLSWEGVSAVTTITDYVIEYKFTTGAAWTTWQDSVNTITTGLITGLINNMSYDFRVSALSGAITGFVSNIISVVPLDVFVPEPQFLYRFAGNYNDTTTNANHAVNSGVTIVTDPDRGLVGRFNGVNSFMTGPTILNVSGFTKAAWVYAATGTTLTARNIINNTLSNYLWVNNTMDGGHSGFSYVADPTTFTSGAWVHVAITFDGPTKKYILYKNGVYVASGTAPNIPLPNAETYIGSYRGLFNFWSGYMDDIEMWDVALTGLQVQAVYEGNAGNLIASVPNAPRNVLATATGSGQVVVSFSGSTYNGGSPILYYIATSTPGNISFTGTGSPITITGLTNGVSYTFTVAAVNEAGTGTVSSGSNAVIPIGTPGAPTNVTATASSGQAIVSFSGPVDNGGTGILYYIATSTPGNISFTGTGSPITITGLTNATSYTFTVIAVNAVGTGAASSASNAVVPIAVANEPTNVMATSSSGQATIYFSGSTYTGGSEILYYTVTSNPGNISATGSGTPIILSGLTNGTSYTFTVRAVNGAGTGTASSASNSVTPAGLPNAPTSLLATGSSGQAIVSFVVPTYTGGSNILYYVLTGSPGNIVLTGVGSPITVTGLINGVSYTFKIAAVNEVGTGEWSSISNTVIPTTVPNAPTNVTATGGNAQATVRFSGSTYTGGSNILYYVVTASTGNISFTGLSSPIRLTGLTNGVAYTFTVTAVNGAGTGTESSASNSIMPLTVPGIPFNILATGGNQQAFVSFSDPLNDGGTGIIEYVVTSSPGGFLVASGTGPITVNGLTNGLFYTFTVRARNGIGFGLESVSSNSVLVATVPTEPTNVTVEAASGQAVVSFSGAADDGGAEILYYAVLANTGNISLTGEESPITVTGLNNGTPYTFTVAAVNVVGTGAESSASNQVVPLTVPNAPTNVIAIAANQEAIISFSGSSYDGGTGIIEYIVTSSPGNISMTGAGSPITVTGLNNGTSYTFTVVARNSVGTGTASSASNSVIPSTIANAPTNVTASGGNQQATISFDPSTDDGGFPILYYIVRSSPGNFVVTGGASPIVVGGLTNGVSYTFTVAARTALATGVTSSPSNSVTPVTVPGAPQNIEAAGTNGEAIFQFDPPLISGGSAILFYNITSITGLVVASSGSSPITVTGFINGTTHTFFVSAINAQGEGASGAVTLTITTPTTAPVTPPMNVVAIPGSGGTVFTFAAPWDNGGLFIDYYRIRSTTGVLIKTGTNSPISLTGLANETLYTFVISAVNQQGEGPGETIDVMPKILAAYATGISGISGESSMIINWETTIPSSTQVQYSISTGYGLQSAESDITSRVTSHSGSFTSLFACTKYNYRFIGSDILGNRYTGDSYSFTTLGCANNAHVKAQEDKIISVPVGGSFHMTADIGTTLDLLIPVDIVLVAPTLVFQGKQLEVSSAIVELGKPSSELIQVGALYDLQAYSGDTDRITTFTTGLTMTLSYRDQDISGVDESTLKIYSHDGTSWSQLDNCMVDMVNNTVTCDTPHFSNFSIFGSPLVVTPSPSSSSFAGGGRGMRLTKDVCPNGDLSNSYYDKTCSSVGLPNLQEEILRIALQKCRALSGEEMQSYCFNHAIGSTTMPTFTQARYYDQITRAQLAKIMGEFAKNIMGKIPDKTKQCTFSGPDPDGLKSYVIQACQLGLMNTSRPNDVLTRGEYVTVLSRMLYGKRYEQTLPESEEHPFYEHHMEQLYKEGLIKIKEPLVQAQRFVPFLTLYRLAQKLAK